MCRLTGLALLLIWPTLALSGQVTVAVATNILEPARRIADAFEAATDHRVRLISGSTGNLYAQIRFGAPYDIFLAADQLRPELLFDEGRLAEPPRTYARGRLVFWTGEAGVTQADLARPPLRRLAMADPAVAPYGLAARQTLDALGLGPAFADGIVLGENVGQAFAFVATGNADGGLLAHSLILSANNRQSRDVWLVPQELHDPILQDGALMQRAATSPAARAFWRYLRGEEAIAIIRSFGYESAYD